MYVYNCNAILTTAMKNISNKEIIRSLTDLTEDLKCHGINPGFHFIDNEAYIALNTKMTSMKIKYQFFPPSNHRANNAEREIKTLKKS